VIEHRHTPDLDRLSVVIALILLAYATTAFVSIPIQTVEWQLPGFLLVANFSFITIVAVVVAVLAGAGTDWLIAAHPHQPAKTHWHHWMVPALTAAAIGIPLGSIEVGPAWWVVFGLGGLLLSGVLVAEYISVDPLDIRYSFAILGLSSVSYALFLIIVSAIISSGFRLYVLLSAIAPTVFLLTARTLFLRLGGNWHLAWASGITLIMVQLAAALFYLPLRPLQLSLVLLGLLYGLISTAFSIEDNRPVQTIWIEPVIMSGAFIVLGFLLK
jgi:hypothetical protein